MHKALKKIWESLWLLPLLVIAVVAIQRGVPDSDTFFLAATGRYIVENGIVPTINPFVIHENFGIIVQQWLFDVMIYGIYNTFGNIGLFCFQTIAYLATILFLYKYFGLFTENKTAKKIVLVICGIVYLSFAVARPTIISFPILLTMLYCMEKYRKTNKKRYLAALPALALLQINIHAAMWPMMFVLLLPYVFPFTLLLKGDIKAQAKTWFNRNKYILLTMVIMFAVGFLNPNGLNGMAYVLKSYGSATGGLSIQELISPNLASGWGLIVVAVVICFAMYIYKNKAKLGEEGCDLQEEFTRASMALGVLILACAHIRNMWYLILGATPVVLDVLNNCSFGRKKETAEISTYKLIIRNTVCIVLIATFAYIMAGISDYSLKTTKDSNLAPIAAADFLDQTNKEDITLYTEFNNGAYMEWRGYKIYMDARPELFQTNINGQENVYEEFCKVQKGTIDYDDFLKKYEFTHLIVTKNSLFEMYLRLNPLYKLAVDGNGYSLYELDSE